MDHMSNSDSDMHSNSDECFEERDQVIKSCVECMGTGRLPTSVCADCHGRGTLLRRSIVRCPACSNIRFFRRICGVCRHGKLEINEEEDCARCQDDHQKSQKVPKTCLRCRAKGLVLAFTKVVQSDATEADTTFSKSFYPAVRVATERDLSDEAIEQIPSQYV